MTNSIKMKKDLESFLQEEGNKSELSSLRNCPDDKFNVRLSSCRNNFRKLNLIISLLNDLYDVEFSDKEMNLVPKSPASI